jgi:hypothetical protein
MHRFAIPFAAVGVLLGLGCTGVMATATSGSTHTLDIVNRVPKFKTFYADATAKPIDADARWALWQKEYGIAAVPPGPEGEKIARKQLDGVWARYPALLPKADALEAEGEADAKDVFARINALFETKDVPIHSRVVLYVGQFDGNAFTIPPMKGQPSTVVMPVETQDMHLQFAHEMTHSVNTQLAGVKNGFGAPVGETMFLEGLAMRTAQKVYPGLPDRDYVAMKGDKHWFERCMAKKDAVLAGIAPDLKKAGRAVAFKYTFGNGNTGMHREVYCAAWIAMGRLIKSGKTFPELARVPENRMIAMVRAALAMK